MALFANFFDFFKQRGVLKLETTRSDDEKEQYTTQAILSFLGEAVCGSAVVGAGLARSIIDFRSQMIAGKGASVQLTEGTTEAKEFVASFVENNNLDGKGLFDLVKISEMEGQCLMFLIFEGDKLKINPVSWVLDAQYEVSVSASKYDFSFTDEKKKEWLEYFKSNKEKSVFVKTSGFSFQNSYVQSVPPAGQAIANLQNIDNSIGDLRSLDSLYGKTVNFVNAPDIETANTISNGLKDMKFKQGAIVSIPGSVQTVSPSSQASAATNEEIKQNIMLISAKTGVPLFALGRPDLFGTKAGFETLADMTHSLYAPFAAAWEKGVCDLIKKAAELENKEYTKSIDVSSITCSIPVQTIGDTDRLVRVYLTLYDAGLISKQTILEKIPDIDVEVEKKRLEVDQEEKDKRNPMLLMGDEKEEEEEEGENEEKNN